MAAVCRTQRQEGQQCCIPSSRDRGRPSREDGCAGGAHAAWPSRRGAWSRTSVTHTPYRTAQDRHVSIRHLEFFKFKNILERKRSCRLCPLGSLGAHCAGVPAPVPAPVPAQLRAASHSQDLQESRWKPSCEERLHGQKPGGSWTWES